MSSVVLVHGAGSGPWVFRDWPDAFPGSTVLTPDLQEGLDVSRASMSDYAERLVTCIRSTARPVTLCGWSMGGLIAAMVATAASVDALVLMEPSPPAEVQGRDPLVELRQGTFDPEAAYGPFPRGIRARPESTLARCERKAGVSVPRLDLPTLVVYGDEFRDERGRNIASFYGCEEGHVEGVDHWGLVTDPRARRLVAGFVTR